MMWSYLHHMMTSLWKRRGLTMMVLVVFALVMVLLQYHNVHEDISSGSHIHKYGGQRTLRTVDAIKPNISDRFRPESGNEDPEFSVVPAHERRVQASWEDAKASSNDRTNNNNNARPDAENAVYQENIVRVFRNDLANSDTKDRHFARGSVQRIGGGSQGVYADVHDSRLGRNNDKSRVFKATNDYGGKLPPVYIPPVSPYGGHVKGYDDRGMGVPVDSGQVEVPRIYIPERRLVHLDMKGAPPKITYLEKLLPILKDLGATGLLLEYEDMFPYDGLLRPAAARNHYSRKEIKDLLRLARDNDLEVIPLVQTFGHLEFVLKLEEFQGLREVPTIPQAICPSRNKSIEMLELMIDQVMALHPGIKWLHIGCDEVFQLAECPICRQRAREDVFLSHVARMASYVRSKHHVIPIVWDDMFHHMGADQLREYDMGRLVEPMIWTYVEDIYRFISKNVWAVYAEVFPYIWAASAYKGAFGETLSAAIVQRHLDNNLAWLDVLKHEQGKFREVRGIALTGWQRYDHFAVLCELLPAAVPSIAVNLLTVTHGYFNQSWQGQLYKTLQCMKSKKYSTFIDLERDPFLWSKMSWCFFPGVSVFKVMERLDGVQKVVQEFIKAETVNKAWLTEYNVRHNFSSVTRIEVSMQDFMRYYYDVETLIKQSRDALREVYDEYTVAEWIEQNVYLMFRKLELIQQASDSLRRANTWPIRPFDPLPDLQRFDIGIPDDNS